MRAAAAPCCAARAASRLREASELVLKWKKSLRTWWMCRSPSGSCCLWSIRSRRRQRPLSSEPEKKSLSLRSFQVCRLASRRRRAKSWHHGSWSFQPTHVNSGTGSELLSALSSMALLRKSTCVCDGAGSWSEDAYTKSTSGSGGPARLVSMSSMRSTEARSSQVGAACSSLT